MNMRECTYGWYPSAEDVYLKKNDPSSESKISVIIVIVGENQYKSCSCFYVFLIAITPQQPSIYDICMR